MLYFECKIYVFIFIFWKCVCLWCRNEVIFSNVINIEKEYVIIMYNKGLVIFVLKK